MTLNRCLSWKLKWSFWSLALVAACWIPVDRSYAQVNVTTFHNDVARTGQNTLEVNLTTANVNSAQFGKLFTTVVDGYVYAQPLYVANVSIGSGTHNVIYVATEHDSVYAIDADSGSIYWQLNLIPAGGRTVVGSTDIATGCNDIIPEMGITGTPVIDLTSGTIYVVTKAYVGGKGIQQLHALDIHTAAERFGGPVTIQASVPGTAPDAKKSVLTFNPIQELQRPALLLEAGHVIIGWGSDCDVAPWHGWLMSYNATTLSQEAIYNASPNGDYAGIWMSGGGPAADAAGNIYFSTGNGDWNGTTDLGDTIVKVGPPSGGTFPVLDYFTPWNQAHMYAVDDDLSSSPPLLLPTLPSNQQLLTLMAKVGTIYVVDRNDMGGYCVNQTPACTNSDPQIEQEIPGASTGVWGSPAYWNGNIYWGAQNDALTAFSFNTTTGRVSTTPTSQTAVRFGYPAPTPSISSNANTNGILWVVNADSYKSNCSSTNTCQILYAYDATNLTHLLYTSNQAANNRDVPGAEVKFATPTIANGKVYVGSQYAVSGFGELGTSAPTAASPAFTPVAGTYTSAQSVKLTDSTPGATIYYTLNGGTPTTASTLYTNAFTVSSTTTVKAIVVAAGYISSPVSTATYTISTVVPTAATPAFAPAAGTYTAAQTVTLSDSTPGAAIYYTLNGSTPTTASTLYTTAFTVNSTITVNAIAVATGYTTSQVGSATYAINSSGTAPISVSLTAADKLYGIGTPGTAVTGGGIDGSGNAYAGTLLGTSLSYAGATYTLPAAGANSVATNTKIALPAGNYTTLSVLGTGVNGNHLNQSFKVTYTDGTTASFSQSMSDWAGGPQGYAGESVALTMPSYVLGSGAAGTGARYLYAYSFTLNSAKTVQSLTLPMTTNVVVVAVDLSAAATVPVALSPVFSPVAGTYPSAQLVTLSDSTPGASIYYTLNGSTPTMTSTRYTAPFTVSSTTTVNAIALATGYSNSPVGGATYTITSGKAPVSVSLTAADTVYAIGTPGIAVTAGGIDGSGDAYAGNLLGTSLTYNGIAYALSVPGANSAARATTIALPAGNFTTLSFLGAGVNGNHLNQVFTVTYTDGTTTNFTQSLSDWALGPQGYAGELVALTMPSYVLSTGATGTATHDLYAYTFALNGAKTVKSLALPITTNVVVLAVDLGTP